MRAVLSSGLRAACLVALAVGGGRLSTASPPGEGKPPGDEAAVAIPDDTSLEASGAVVGRILVRAGNVFDPTLPGEDLWLFRLANRLHFRTRESVIRELLLFREGDRYSRRVLEESERFLRTFGFLYDARIRPVAARDGAVDVEVVTRDVWTLRASVDFSRSGGENTVRFSLEDTNFLGSGREMTFRRSDTVDRSGSMIRYRDPRLFGSRARMEAAYFDNSDGVQRYVWLERPFFSLEARWAAGLSLAENDREDSLYELGEVTDRFRHRSVRVEAFGGVSKGLVGRRALRLLFGYAYEDDRFAPVSGALPDGFEDSTRRIAYPWVGFESVEDGFVTSRDLDQIQKTEDLNLARTYGLRLGWASHGTGADRTRLVYRASYSQGVRVSAANLLLASAEATGRWGSGKPENLLATSTLRFFHRQPRGNALFAALRADAAEALDPERQLLLGGDNGLRGYPLRYQDGDRRLLLTVEQRFYADWHVLKLFYLGAAIFADAGRAWFVGRHDDLGLLRDVGFGLRISSSRTSAARMVKVDVAFPLDGDRSIDNVQFLVTTGERF